MNLFLLTKALFWPVYVVAWSDETKSIVLFSEPLFLIVIFTMKSSPLKSSSSTGLVVNSVKLYKNRINRIRMYLMHMNTKKRGREKIYRVWNSFQTAGMRRSFLLRERNQWIYCDRCDLATRWRWVIVRASCYKFCAQKMKGILRSIQWCTMLLRSTADGGICLNFIKKLIGMRRRLERSCKCASFPGGRET